VKKKIQRFITLYIEYYVMSSAIYGSRVSAGPEGIGLSLQAIVSPAPKLY